MQCCNGGCWLLLHNYYCCRCAAVISTSFEINFRIPIKVCTLQLHFEVCSICTLISVLRERTCINIIIIISIYAITKQIQMKLNHYRVSGLSCPEAQAYLTVIFHSFLHNNNINSDYILGANIYFTPHSIFSSYFWANN